MIDATIHETTRYENESWPKLMCSQTREDFIVIFSSPGVGTVLCDTDRALKPYPVGYYATDWDMRTFEPFHGEITLKNE